MTIALLLLPLLMADTPADIVRRSLDRDNRNWDRAKDYTFQQKTIQRDIDSNGRIKKTTAVTHDIIVLYGRPFSRLVEKDGKPLDAKAQAKEEERFNKEVERRRRETQEENSRERRKYEERRARTRQFTREIPEAFNFTFEPEETIGGRPVWVIRAEPRPGYSPRDDRAKFLPKLHGKLWIDKTDLQWVKVEASTIGTISIGLFLARIGPGTILTFEQRRVNDELWLPSHAFLKVDARLALLKKIRSDVEIDFRNYRKFQVDTRMTIPESQ